MHTPGLYGFVLDAHDGRFLAHGGCASYVGATLDSVAAAAALPASGAELLAAFRHAAATGGGMGGWGGGGGGGGGGSGSGGSWVAYQWRGGAGEPLHVKGARCRLLQLESPRRDALAVLCYGSADAAPPSPGALPAPPPVAPSRAAVRAAALALRAALARAGGDRAAIAAAVRDEHGALATAAAEGLGWEVTELPTATLAGVRLQ
jgi:hypothetical protein